MKKQQKQALEIGAGIAAVAAIAGGIYMMTGKNAKNRKKVAKWAKDMQNDVLRELDKAGKVTKATYNKVIDTAAKNYKGLKNVNALEVAAAAAELKGHWDNIYRELNSASATVGKVVPNTVRKLAKKVTAKKAPARKAAPAKKAAAKKAPAKKAAKKRR